MEPTPDDTTLIKDATSATYTPVSEDADYCLRVKVSYLDRNYASGSFDKSVVKVLSAKVQGSSTNVAPEFDSETATRHVLETAKTTTGDNPSVAKVGAPVKAEDNDTLTYTLEGADKDLFTIDSTTNTSATPLLMEGQINLKAGVKLDHETKPTLTLKVKATDPHGDTDTIDVTIKVIDVDEAPTPVGNATRTVSYIENKKATVLTLSARDPEGAAPIIWSILTSADGIQDIDDDGTDDVVNNDITNHALFNIKQTGELTFGVSPSYESGATLAVVVQMSDGSENSWFKVTVNVLDVEETGSVKLRPAQERATLLQPQVGVEITAHTLEDPDGNASDARNDKNIDEGTASWQWYRSSSKTETGTALTSTDATDDNDYTPVADDIGKYLRVVATYNDGRGSSKKATAVSEYQTIATISTNSRPEFSEASPVRVMLESAAPGTSIGNPVTATDDDSSERLTYWLTSGDDNEKFDIDAKTGQLKVKDKLNYETPVQNDGTVECTSDACSVTVNATDSSGGNEGTGSVRVTINVTGVGEAPIFDTADLTATPPVNPIEVVIQEKSTGDNLRVGDYRADDPENDVPTLSLTGADAGMFKLADNTATEAGKVYQTLSFKASPNFEAPGDSNRDNVYQVTVVASDGANSTMEKVVVKVTDVAEDGKLEVTPVQPRVGTLLTVAATDPEGVSAPTWEWRRLEVNTNTTCPVAGDDAWNPETTVIKDATSATYTPVSEDADYCLRVKVSYLDRNYASGSFDKSVVKVLSAKVQGPSTNVAPKFSSETATRYVPENSSVGVHIGMPVAAKDDETLNYTLSGADAGLFEILDGDDAATTGVTEKAGQIRVKNAAAMAMLDHETKPTLTVTVTATDPRGATDTITVTIMVTDVDEEPVIMEGGIAIGGMSAPSFAENSTDAVATYTASGPNAATATWSLEGDDSSRFMLDGSGASRMLKFTSAPDYENPRGQAMSDDQHQYLHGNGEGHRQRQLGHPARNGDGHRRRRGRHGNAVADVPQGQRGHNRHPGRRGRQRG